MNQVFMDILPHRETTDRSRLPAFPGPTSDSVPDFFANRKLIACALYRMEGRSCVAVQSTGRVDATGALLKIVKIIASDGTTSEDMAMTVVITAGRDGQAKHVGPLP